MRISNFFKLVIAIAVSELAGIIGSFFTVPSIRSGWYAEFAKPALNPPSWVFGPVWTTLYALMGISLFLVWSSYAKAAADKKKHKKHSNILQNIRMFFVRQVRRWGIILFFVQLAFNAMWSIIFFGFQNPGWALVDIVLLWFAIAWTMAVFYKISRPAAYLLVPYILWVSFAVYLNYVIWILN